jgi:poly(A) polymerase
LNELAYRQHTPVIIPRAEHPISRSLISGAALKVLYRLKDGGYQAFLVGGCIRDILLGIEPKDFDIATDAHPDEVRRLFRNCRLIGRRFRLAHVRFGDEIIEVATFRAAHLPGDPEELETLDDEGMHDVDEAAAAEEALDEPTQDDSGRLLSDNVYGTIDQDVWRRDFTCNALYYNIDDFSIWDYTGGAADTRDRVLRLIGDPETRFREDPVRMLRAVRFQAKLGFTLHQDTLAPVRRLARLLDGIPPARLLDEFSKLFLAGFARRSFDLLAEHHLLEHLFPSLGKYLKGKPHPTSRELLYAGLDATDRRVAEGKSVTPTFLFAVLLFGPISAAAQRRFEDGHPASHAIAEACDEVIGAQVKRLSIPKRFSIPLREMLALQPRFHRREGRKALALLTHPRFRAAYDFLLLRAAAGAEEPAIAQWWTEIQELPPDERIQRVEAARAPGQARSDGGGRRRRRGGRRPKAGG